MNEESQGVMEEQILAEENAPHDAPKPAPGQPQPKKQKPVFGSLKDWFYKLKAPKPISYLILCSLIIIIYTGFLLLSTKQAAKTPRTASQVDLTSSPTPTPNSQVESMRKKVDDFSNYIDSISSSTRKFSPPNIDLNINFTSKK